MKIQCGILLPLILLFTSCATVDEEINTSSDEEITISSGEEINTSSGEDINTSSGEWINLYDNQTTFAEIVELRGPPFDVQLNEDKIKMSFYYFLGERDPFDSTTTRLTLRKEEVEFDSSGKFLNVSNQEKERVFAGRGIIGDVANTAAAVAIGSRVLIDFVTLSQSIATSNPRSDEMIRVKKFLESRSLTFSIRMWNEQRLTYNLWV